MAPTAETPPFERLKSLLSASRVNYDACLDHIDHTDFCTGIAATTRLHHLRRNPNGQLKLESLAQCLAKHAIDFAISARRRPESMTAQEAMELAQEARHLFRVVAANAADTAGDAGELLLYFLLEAVVGAPQVVAKYELKTNPAVEVHGSDGIHMRVHPDDGIVDIYFGEAKCYQSVSTAIGRAFTSIEAFHEKGLLEHEYALVTSHFKGVDDLLKAAVIRLLDTGAPGPDCRINHACLIAYDWSATGLSPEMAADQIDAEYRKQLLADSGRLHQLLQAQVDACKVKQFRFEVFFLPFDSVQAFRDAFERAMR